MKYIKYFFLTTIAAGLLYFAAGELFLPSERADHFDNYQVFESDWVWIKSDGTEVPVEVPTECDVEQNEKVTFQTVLPDNLEDNTYLCFRSLRQDMWIYIDHTLYRQYTTKDTRLLGSTSSSTFVFFQLKQEYSGKTLTVITQSDSAYSGTFRTVYYGDRLSLWKYIFDENLADIIVAVLMLILGIACVIISLVVHYCYHKKLAFEYLGWGITIASSWLLFNSAFRQLLFPNISIASDMTFLCVMILPIPFLLFMNDIQHQRYEKLYLLSGGLAVLDTVICLALYVTGQKDFSESIFYMEIVCLIAILCVAITIMIDIFKGYIKEYFLISLGILGCCVAAIMQLLLYVNRFSINFSGIMLAIGLSILLISASVSTGRDILQMEKEKQQAIMASRSKSQFLANMSHEIRTPINSVLGMDEMILRESSEPQIIEYAKDIQSAGRSLLSLINDILDFSKIESGKLEIIPMEYSVSSLLNDCYNMIYMRAKDKNLSVEIKNNPSLPNHLLGDEVRLRQIILNLLTNAVKYTKKGTITLSIDGWKTSLDTLLVEISVADTGIGIKPEDQKKLFQSFQRVEEQRNRNIEGTGLGLAITRQLVDLMNGTLEVESEYGKGSTFTVTLPQTIISAETLGDFSNRFSKSPVADTSAHKEFFAPEGRILVVDDVAMNLKVVVGLLKNTGLQIDTAESGEQCLEMVKEKTYHIIFLDHMMPVLSGIETLQLMREMPENKNSDTPVIMLTANAILGAKEEYLEAGFMDYLSKPVTVDELENMILKYLPKELIEEASGSGMPSAQFAEPKSFLESLSFLDVKQGLGYCTDNEDLYKEILQAYLKNNQLTLLTDLYRKQDWENYQIQVHSVKSSSLSVGATALSEQAKQLEMAAKNNDFSYIETHHTDFMEAYGKLLEQLKSVL